jgi:hypothetical protein
MTLLPHWKKSGFLSSLVFFYLVLQSVCSALSAQQLAAYQDNQGYFFIFDKGKTIQAEYLPVKQFSVGGQCLLYVDSQNHLKMYYRGNITTLEVNQVSRFAAMDYLSVYSIGNIVKIVENGQVTTISTYAVQYIAEDSLVAFYDRTQQLLAVYYKGRIQMLEDGLTGRTNVMFKAADNIVAFVSLRTGDLKAFTHGKIQEILPFVQGGSFKTGRDVVAYVAPSEQNFRVFFKGTDYTLEDFPPASYQVGDDIVGYVDNTGSFKIFSNGETTQISSFPPDFYQVRDKMIIYGEKGYFKVWYEDNPYLLETYVPNDWKAEWNTIVYRDLNKNIKIFTKGDSKILTYDLAEKIELYRDLVVVNKGMNNWNVYYLGKKY